MSWLIVIAVIISTAASVFAAYACYTFGRAAATSAVLAKHAATEAAQERKVASQAARFSVAASGRRDPGTAVDTERISGVPEPEPAHHVAEPADWKRGGFANWHGEDTSPPLPPRPEPAHRATVVRPDGLPWQFGKPTPGTPAHALDESWRQALDGGWSPPPDPTQSGAQSSPTGSAPEVRDHSGAESSPTEPMRSPGAGGGDTSPTPSSGAHSIHEPTPFGSSPTGITST
jgi:hypothetical protein